jgi:hypothetical protein
MSPGLEISAGVGLLRLLISPFSWIWRRLRFGPRVDLELTWKHPMMWFIGDPLDKWRGLEITVVAPKHEEFAVAKGAFDVRHRLRWKRIGVIDEHISLPWVIDKNRADSRIVTGGAVADWITTTIGDADTASLRVTLADHHRLRATSASLTVSVAELRKKEREF